MTAISYRSFTNFYNQKLYISNIDILKFIEKKNLSKRNAQ
jgi:hypothetical protein